MTISSADLVVIGGGIHGCSAALHAAMRGLSVIVVEKDTVGRHASGANAGGVRRLLRDFAEISISVRSMEIWENIGELVDDDCGFKRAPQVQIAETEDQLDAMCRRLDELRALGFDHEVILDQAQLRELLPSVTLTAIGGLACLTDGFAQPYQTTFAFQRKAQALGVQFLENVRVLTVQRQRDDWILSCSGGATVIGRNLLNCAGAWAGEIARQLGEEVPITARAPMMSVTSRMPHFCDAVAIGPPGRPLSFKQMPNGTVVIGGGRQGSPDPERNATEIDFGELRMQAETAIALFPIMGAASIIRTWAGIEAYTPDELPVIGRSSIAGNAFHAFGFSGHGFQLGPGVGEIMAELIATGTSSAAIQAFTIERFA